MIKNEKTWREFYAAAVEFRDLKPWEWMYDADLFGVEDPETGQTNYCCIMGNAGEVFALGYYLGEEGLKSYLLLVSQPEKMTDVDRMAIGLGQLMLKVEFVDRNETEEAERDQFKKLGLKFRGKRQWVQARFVKPGYMPEPIDAEQARALTVGLRQAIDVATRYREGEILLGRETTGETLVRKKKGGQWIDDYEPPKSFTITPFPAFSPDKDRIRQIRQQFPQKKAAWLLIYEYMPVPVGDDSGKHYYFPKINVWVDYASRSISSFELIPPGTEAGGLEKSFFKQIEGMGYRPKQIGVNSAMALNAVRGYCESLDIELMFVPDEPAFEEVMSSFRMFMGPQPGGITDP